MARHKIEWERAVHTREQFPKEKWPQVAFAGRSNVGKSSLLNQIFDHKLAGVSQTPGKTRSVNFYRVDEKFFMVDLPGYGYAKVSKVERHKFSSLIGFYLENNAWLSGVVHLMDMRHPPTKLDLNVAAYLKDLGMEHLEVDRRSLSLFRPCEHLGRPLHELAPPLVDLVRVNVVALSQLSQRDLSLDGSSLFTGNIIPGWSRESGI